MATRIYVQSGSTPAVSPSFDTEWDGTATAVRVTGNTVKQGTPRVESPYTEPSSASANNLDHLALQVIYGPIGGGTISGTFKAYFHVEEEAAGVNARSQVIARIVRGDTLATRHTLYAGDLATQAAGNPTNEFLGSIFQNRAFPRAAPVAVSSGDSVNGDYIVVELGSRHHNTASIEWDGNHFIVRDDVGTDLPENQTHREDTGGAADPWIEFSANIPAYTAAGLVYPDQVYWLN